MFPHYRLYLLDGGGRIYSVIVLASTADDDAIAEAETAAPLEARELWDRGRLLKAWNPEGDAGRASHALAAHPVRMSRTA